MRRFWNAPHMAEREGLKAVQMFEAIERGEIKALWVMATNPAVSLPRAGAVRDALKKLELFVVSENVLSQRHRVGVAACAAARRRLGREGRHRHQLRAAHLAPARLSAAAGRGPAGLVDRLRGRAALGYGGAFAYRSAADVFREHAALSAFENDGARAFDLGGLAAMSDEDYDALEPVQWPVRAGADRFHALVRRRPFHHARPQGALHRAGAAGASRGDQRRISAAAQHRPHARPVAHHDAHRPEPAARRAHARAVRRDPSARRQAPRPCRTTASPASALAHGACMLKVVTSAPSSAARCSRRSTGAARTPRRRASAIWSRRRPIRSPASPRPRRRRRRRAGRIRLSRLCARRASRSRCRTEPGGRASRCPALQASCLRQTTPRWHGTTARPISFRRRC